VQDPLKGINDAELRAGVDAYLNWQSLPAMAFDQMRKYGEKPFLWSKRDGAFRSQSFSEVAQAISDCAHGLCQIGVRPGDRIALIAENRPEWLVADFASMSAGAVTVPAYTTNTVADHRHVLGDSGALWAIVSTVPLLEQVMPAAMQLDTLKGLILIDGSAPKGAAKPIISWLRLLQMGADRRGQDPAGPLYSGKRDDLACLIYTSGTGGTPKGVMLSHGALLCNAMGAFDLLYELDQRVPEDEVFLSFLPLSHAYEHTAGLVFPVSIGAQIYYAEGVEALARNMVEVRPTIMTAVPRLYETLHGRVLSGLRGQSAFRQKLFWKAVELGQKKYRTGRLSIPERFLDMVLEKLVRAKVKERFGGRIKAMISGGAPLNYEIGLFFTALGLRLLQGYGQTETAPVASCNRPHKVKLETVGPPLRGVEVQIADDGEILVWGELTMQGYWNAPKATAATLRNGWVHTGDVGEIDEDGYIRITDRKKDIIVLSGGETLSPQRVEGVLQLEPEIFQAMVVGDKQPYLVALIVPDADAARDWAKSMARNGTLDEWISDDDFRHHIENAVDRANATLSASERIRRFALIADPFEIENAMLTPSLKIRRHVIVKTYGERLAALRR
jgi:long-chain acyl-CoA synthetase